MRRGLVLGGGGVLGGTWSIAALRTLESEHGLTAADFDTVVGTSAGALLGTLARSGVAMDELIAHTRGEQVRTGPLVGLSWDPDVATGGPRPGLPLPRPGSLRLVGAGLRHLGSMPPTALLSGLLPAGSRSLDRIGLLVDAVVPHGTWPESTWVCAMDFDAGRRVAFGRPGAPSAPIADAVMASCAIPGWFTPVEIAGRTYVDGGAISATSVDVLVDEQLDEVVVVAPMIAVESDEPRSLQARLERRWRAELTRICQAEAALLEARGTSVVIMGPGRTELEAIGANLMDRSRRLSVLDASLEATAQRWRTLPIAG